jgi:hypothetical protein
MPMTGHRLVGQGSVLRDVRPQSGAIFLRFQISSG